MGSINLTNSKGRDAVVATRHVASALRVRWVDAAGRQAHSARVLAAPLDRDLPAILQSLGGDDAIGKVVATLQQAGEFVGQRVGAGARAVERRPQEEDQAMHAVRLDNFLTFLGPGGLATPDDVEVLESCQVGYQNAWEVGAEWNDISKGMGSPEPQYDDELQMRVFWTRWNQMLNAG